MAEHCIVGSTFFIVNTEQNALKQRTKCHINLYYNEKSI